MYGDIEFQDEIDRNIFELTPHLSMKLTNLIEFIHFYHLLSNHQVPTLMNFSFEVVASSMSYMYFKPWQNDWTFVLNMLWTFLTLFSVWT